jgi:hypothetical protein
MAIHNRNILGDPLPSGSSGDGASNATGSQADPNTGDVNKSYRAPQVQPRQSTTGALGDETAHGDIEAWQRSTDRPGLGVGIQGNGSGGITVGNSE